MVPRVPSRQLTRRRSLGLRHKASCLTESGACPASRRSNFGGRPIPPPALAGSGAKPGGHTEVEDCNTIILGADHLSKAIASATWHAMLDDHREAAYEVMQTIALKQGIDRIRMFNRAGQVMFSTNPEDRAGAAET